MAEVKKICKNCCFWKNEQSELHFSTIQGICVRHLWTTSQNNVCMVLDRQNYNSEGQRNPAHKFEAIESYSKHHESNYALVPYEEFGCTFWNKKNGEK